MTGIPKGVTRVDVLQAIRWSHFLRSDEANYITGTTLTPVGGYTLTV